MKRPWLNPVRTEFVDRLNSGRLAHALLLSGPAGTGKQDLAREMAAGLLCLESGMQACGNCRSCQLLDTGAHPDFRLIKYELNDKGVLRKELVIEQIRNLISALQLTTTISTRKVALLHPAEAMNRNAANALLKTLEEPPGDTVLILVSHDPGRLPVTIRSRCQSLHIRLPEEKITLGWLIDLSGCTQAEAETALKAAAGSPLHALEMLSSDRVAHYNTVSHTLDELLIDNGHTGRALTALAEVQAEIEPEQFWTWLSLCTAEKVRRNIGRQVNVKLFSRLQAAADKNRALMTTQVRKDLLLQDWLIQWSRIKA